MVPDRQIRGAKKVVASNNLYTVILALALGVVLATAGLVAFKCHLQYETIFHIVP